MEKGEVIRLLNEDIRGEHGAIILYLRTAYALGEGELAAEIEQIARDEMRHFKWLSEEVVRLGGLPTTERDEPGAHATEPLSMLHASIEAEQGAIQQYTAHIEAIDETRIVRLLERIRLDEQEHLEAFQQMAQTLEASPAAAEAPAEPPSQEVADAIQQDVKVEYTTLLEYLQQSFLTPDCPLSKDLLDQAIIEMMHMGWLAEYLAEAGTPPRLEHAPVKVEADPERALKANVQKEADVEALYREQIEKVEDPALRQLLQRILDHSVYHEAHFRDLLADVQAKAASATPKASESSEPKAPTPERGKEWTVGSLLGRKQE